MAVERIIDLVFRLRALGQDIPDRLVASFLKLKAVVDKVQASTTQIPPTLSEVVRSVGLTETQFLKAAERVGYFLARQEELRDAARWLPTNWKKASDTIYGFSDAARYLASEFRKPQYLMEQAIRITLPDLIREFNRLGYTYEDVSLSYEKGKRLLQVFSREIGERFPRYTTFFDRAMWAMQHGTKELGESLSEAGERTARFALGLLAEVKAAEKARKWLQELETGLEKPTLPAKELWEQIHGLVSEEEFLKGVSRKAAVDAAKLREEFLKKSEAARKAAAATVKHLDQMEPVLRKEEELHGKVSSAIEERAEAGRKVISATRGQIESYLRQKGAQEELVQSVGDLITAAETYRKEAADRILPTSVLLKEGYVDLGDSINKLIPAYATLGIQLENLSDKEVEHLAILSNKKAELERNIATYEQMGLSTDGLKRQLRDLEQQERRLIERSLEKSIVDGALIKEKEEWVEKNYALAASLARNKEIIDRLANAIISAKGKVSDLSQEDQRLLEQVLSSARGAEELTRTLLKYKTQSTTAARSTTLLGESTEKTLQKIYRFATQSAKSQFALRQLADYMIRTKNASDETAQALWEQAVQGRNAEKVARELARMIQREQRAIDDAGGRWWRFNRGVERWGNNLNRLGIRMGWLAYRSVILGRIVTRYLTRAFQRTINTLVNWESSIETVVTTMGYLDITGQLTADRMSFLQSTLEDLPFAGMKVAGAFGYLQSALIGLIVYLAEPLQQAFLAIGDALVALAPVVQRIVVPALFELVAAIIELLPDLVAIARVAIPAFIEGIRSALPVLIGFVRVLQPIIPALARLLGFFVPFAPVIMAVGTALYFLSTVLTGFGSILTIGSKLVHALSIAHYMLMGAISKEIPLVNAAAVTAARLNYVLAQHKLMVLGVIGVTVAAIGIFAAWYYSQTRTAKAVDKTTKKFEEFTRKTAKNLRNLAKSYDLSMKGFNAMSITIYDKSGDILYNIDLLTGEVTDAMGNIVGSYNAATGVITDFSGNLIGILDTTANTFVSASGDVYNFSQNVVSAFDDVASEIGELESTLEDLDLELDVSGIVGPLESVTDQWEASMDQMSMLTGISMTVMLARIHPVLGALGLLVYMLTEGNRILAEWLESLGLTAQAMRDFFDTYLNIDKFFVERGWTPEKVFGGLVEEAQKAVSGVEDVNNEIFQTKGPLEAIGDTARAVANAINWLASALQNLCFRHATPQAIAFNEQLATTLDLTRKASAAIGAMGGGLRTIAPEGIATPLTVGTPTQYITMYVTIPIEQISSEVDLEMLQDSINKGIAEAFRRRFP